MRTLKVLMVVLFALFVTGVGVQAETATVATFGGGLSPDLELTPIQSIVADPDAWVGKRVRIAGEVSGVCTEQGCWMDLTSPDDVSLRVKVDDGVIVFPADAKGLQAVAEGEVEILDMSPEKFEAWLRHVAEEEGREFDLEEIGEPPHRIVRLRGIAAEIKGL